MNCAVHLTSTPALNRLKERLRGFSLVELLVVVGIIAVLIAMLVPSLARSREAAKCLVCQNNLKQIIGGVFSYCADNDGQFPGCAESGAESWDWIYWCQTGTPYTDLNQSAIAQYLGTPLDPNIFRCPSDDCLSHVLGPTNGNYHGGNIYYYSYSGNCWFFNGGSRGTTGMRLSKINAASTKVIMIDEDERTINDGYWCPYVNDNSDVLSDRHDLHGALDPSTMSGSELVSRGNMAFADGHVGFQSRLYLEDFNNIHP